MVPKRLVAWEFRRELRGVYELVAEDLERFFVGYVIAGCKQSRACVSKTEPKTRNKKELEHMAAHHFTCVQRRDAATDRSSHGRP